MLGAKPELDKDHVFTIGTTKFAVGFAGGMDRGLALSIQTNSTADSWTWMVVEAVDGLNISTRALADILKKFYIKATTKLKEYLANIGGGGGVDPSKIPNLTGEAMLAWLIKNRTRVDAVGNITLDDSGI